MRQSNRISSFGTPVLLGAAAMYYLDPQRGRQRRALLRDRVIGVSNDLSDFMSKAVKNLGDEALGTIASARIRRPAAIGDEVLVARIRSRMGRYLSHPKAIEVYARDGQVTLKGDVLQSELQTLLSCAHAVRGVRSLTNELYVHERAEGVPALQGGHPHAGRHYEIMQTNWSPGFRLLMGSVAVALLSSSKSGPWRAFARSAAAGALVRSITNRPFKRIAEASRARYQSLQRSFPEVAGREMPARREGGEEFLPGVPPS